MLVKLEKNANDEEVLQWLNNIILIIVHFKFMEIGFTTYCLSYAIFTNIF